MNGFEERLAKRWRQPLPGPAAQARFAPELGYGRHFSDPPADARRAAVLTLLYPVNAANSPNNTPSPRFHDWRLPLIVRPTHLEHHGGQIGLPGGMIEGNETPEAAALRELHEELGVPSDQVAIVGRLSPLYVYVSNNYVTVCVAVAKHAPTFILNVDEVAELIELPLSCLVDPASRGGEVREHRGVRFRAPYLACGSHRIWGATAMILGELAAVLPELQA